MDNYGERVREVLDKLIEENPQHSRFMLEQNLFNVEGLFCLKPFFSSPSFYSKVAQKVKQRLEQCGWKDEVRLECNKIIKKRGLENIHDMDELVQEVTPFARAKVPMELKKELVAMLKDALIKELEGTNLNP